jgi:predicted transcriptional regulator
LNQTPTPTPGELEILKVLWEIGPSSVRIVYDLLRPRRDRLAYNTVQTLLRIMEDKRLVEHDVEGRTFIYRPRFSRDESVVRFLDRVFDGAVGELVMSLVRSERVTAEELQDMQTMIAEARSAKASVRRPAKKTRLAGGENK